MEVEMNEPVEIDDQMKQLEESNEKLNTEIHEYEVKLKELKDAQNDILKQIQSLQDHKALHDTKEVIDQCNATLNENWVEKQFAWSEEINTILVEKLSLMEFRPKQLAAINAILSKCHVLAVLPTGGGKSLIFQIPILLDKIGYTLILSPLISMINDQVKTLNRMGIKAVAVYKGVEKQMLNSIYNSLTIEGPQNRSFDCLYTTPEWLSKCEKFYNLLLGSHKTGAINRIVIDEIHTCSSKSPDFKFSSLQITTLTEKFPDVPILGLTATASETVLADLRAQFNIQDNCVIIRDSIQRPHITYKVLNKSSSNDIAFMQVVNLIQKNYMNQSGIIYVGTEKDCHTMKEKLTDNNIATVTYYSKMEHDRKSRTYNKWLKDVAKVMVTTVALSKGVHKLSVRFVIQFRVPKSLEAMYQESGRAGRDNLPADVILYFNLNDYFRCFDNDQQTKDTERLAILEYCTDTQRCRHGMLEAYFDNSTPLDCTTRCDNCVCNYDTKCKYLTYNVEKVCQELHTIIKTCKDNGYNLTLKKLVDSWMQTGPKIYHCAQLKKPKINREDTEILIAFLLYHKFLRFNVYETLYSNIYYMRTDRSPAQTLFKTTNTLLGFKRMHIKENCTVLDN